jgi:hypothetical protein
MPPVTHSCTLAVTKNMSDKDAEKLCEYFASRLKPIHVEYNGRKGTLHIKWSPNRFVKTFKTLEKCLENVRPITEDSEDVDAVAYAFHSKYVGADTSVDRPHNKPKYPSHVLPPQWSDLRHTRCFWCTYLSRYHVGISRRGERGCAFGGRPSHQWFEMDDDLYQDVHSFGEVARTSHDKHQDHTKGWEKMSRRGTAPGLGLLVQTCRWPRRICVG